MALAFLFGVAFGWVLWGARPKTGESGENNRTGVEEPKEIIVLKAELQAARALLEQADDKEEDIAGQLSTLDEMVKRANGRLKTILAAVKRAAGGD